jgi:hypothetical protein
MIQGKNRSYKSYYKKQIYQLFQIKAVDVFWNTNQKIFHVIINQRIFVLNAKLSDLFTRLFSINTFFCYFFLRKKLNIVYPLVTLLKAILILLY